MKLTDAEKAKFDKIKRQALVDEDYGEIPIDTMLSLIGDVPWLVKLIDRLSQEPEV